MESYDRPRPERTSHIMHWDHNIKGEKLIIYKESLSWFLCIHAMTHYDIRDQGSSQVHIFVAFANILFVLAHEASFVYWLLLAFLHYMFSNFARFLSNSLKSSRCSFDSFWNFIICPSLCLSVASIFPSSIMIYTFAYKLQSNEINAER